MGNELTFLKLAESVLDDIRKPLTVFEIWENAEKSNLTKKVSTTGKTPWNSIGAQIYIDMRDNHKSVII
ncbi:MAG: winged helix-turn-helix domain-containing protein [archaeon]|nr:winged helix-turn-helix domain-containing protein [archaeon]